MSILKAYTLIYINQGDSIKVVKILRDSPKFVEEERLEISNTLCRKYDDYSEVKAKGFRSIKDMSDFIFSKNM